MYEEDLEVIKVSDLFENIFLKNVYGKNPKQNKRIFPKLQLKTSTTYAGVTTVLNFII